MAVQTTKTNKPFNPRGNDQSPKGYNRAALYSGKALDFDGVNDYVDCGTLDVTAYTGISMSFSFQLANITDNGLRLVSLLHSNLDDIRIEQGLSVLRITLDDGTAYTLETPSLTANEWNKFDMTFNGTTLEGYINGVSIGSMSASFDFSTANGLLNLYKHTAASSYAEGSMSGFKIFNTALTAAQVADLYNNPEKVVPTGVDNTALKLWLPMQEGAGTTAYDGSGNGNHGTISGATWTHGIGAPVSQTAVIDWNKGTNKLSDSSDLENATYWLEGGDTAVEGGYTAPDGTNTAYKVTGTNDVLVSQGATQSSDYRAIWARTTSGTGTAQLLSHNSNTNNTFNITEEWQKFSVDSSNTTGGVNFYVVDFRGSGTLNELIVWQPHCAESESVLVPTIGTAQTSPVLLPQGLTSGRDITGVNLFENVRKQGALNLDGNSWAEVHDNASLDFSSGMSLEAWVKLEDTTQVILGKWDFAGNKKEYLLYYNASTNVLQAFFGNGSSVQFTSTSYTGDGSWIHFVGTTDGSTITPYLNGVAGTTTAQTTSLGASDIPVRIGVDNIGGGYSPNPIAQPRIYNRALTAEEVQRNYNAGKNTYTN